jgi:hypothetical protein
LRSAGANQSAVETSRRPADAALHYGQEGARFAWRRLNGWVKLRKVVEPEWQILLVAEVADWFDDLTKNDPDSADLVEDAVDRLAMDGPALGRPLVDGIKSSKHHNMKELRPGSSGSSEVRILFVSIRSDALYCWLPATSPATGEAGTTPPSRWPTNATTHIWPSSRRGTTNECRFLERGQAAG